MDIRHIYIPSVFTNAYLLADEATGAAALIDPGDGDAATLSAAAKCLDEGGYTLRHIFLTHGHYDHVGGVAAFRSAYPEASVWLHPGDAGLNDPKRPTAALDPVSLWRDGDVVPLGSLQVEVLHTPGHTPGSVCLRCREALFTGDTLFAGTMGRTDFEGGSGEQMAASLKRLGELEGDFAVYPGHMGPTTLETERRTNPYLRMALDGEWTQF